MPSLQSGYMALYAILLLFLNWRPAVWDLQWGASLLERILPPPVRVRCRYCWWRTRKQFMDRRIAARVFLRLRNEDVLHENLISQAATAASRKLFCGHCNLQKHRNDIETDFLLSKESKVSPRVMSVEAKDLSRYPALSRAGGTCGRIAAQ